MKCRNFNYPLNLQLKLKCQDAICVKNYVGNIPAACVVVVVEWLACLPSTQTIRIRIPLGSKVFFCKIVLRNKNK